MYFLIVTFLTFGSAIATRGLCEGCAIEDSANVHVGLQRAKRDSENARGDLARFEPRAVKLTRTCSD